MLLRRNLTLTCFLAFVIFASMVAAGDIGAVEDIVVPGEDAINTTERRIKEAEEIEV